MQNRPLTTTVAKASGEITTVSRSMTSLEKQADTQYSDLQALAKSQADEITGLHSKIDTMMALLTSMKEGQAEGAVTLRLP